MKTKSEKGYRILLLLPTLITLGALVTLSPSVSASKECFLGYKALCSFAPISTIICLIAAGLLCVIRRRKFTEAE